MTCKSSSTWPPNLSLAAQEKLNELEAELGQHRGGMQLGYTDGAGAFHKASSVQLGNTVKTNDDEATREAAWQVRMSAMRRLVWYWCFSQVGVTDMEVAHKPIAGAACRACAALDRTSWVSGKLVRCLPTRLSECSFSLSSWRACRVTRRQAVPGGQAAQ